MDAGADLERGRDLYAERAWLSAHRSLTAADQAVPLGPEDLELLATSAYMVGRDDEYLSVVERAHHAYLDHDEAPRAARCAFWIGLNLRLRGEPSRATGWFARAQRLLDRSPGDCVERGYLLIPVVIGSAARGDWEAAAAAAAGATDVGERFSDPDLLAMAVHEHGHALVRQGRGEEGLRLLDEAMVAVTGGELSPIATGLVYCSVIAYCQDLYELRRAREWTVALTQWCERQPDMVAHTGICLVHRAEILELQGAWPEALEEARRARERCANGMVNQTALGHAIYRHGEIKRLLGEFTAAEEAYREATRHGCEPQPGLALLRLSQGNADAAAAAIRRVLGETPDRLKRARLLAAYVETMLARGDVQQARSACRELEDISTGHASVVLGAMSAAARGEVVLAEGDPGAALVALRHACSVWRELEAPYELARLRVLVGLACRRLGDDDVAVLELEAARSTFQQLGAASDLARLDLLVRRAALAGRHGLTERELEVLRLVATGKSNREIATALTISEHTVRRHLQNIFAKLGLSSRTAASAFAFAHDLV